MQNVRETNALYSFTFRNVRLNNLAHKPVQNAGYIILINLPDEASRERKKLCVFSTHYNSVPGHQIGSWNVTGSTMEGMKVLTFSQRLHTACSYEVPNALPIFFPKHKTNTHKE